ncbi:MAG: hypothetical protein KDD99_23625, partial [Bacteroidetes bacterium]|nr:hypothetical protein [Bacteroidota bacterium]
NTAFDAYLGGICDVTIPANIPEAIPISSSHLVFFMRKAQNAFPSSFSSANKSIMIEISYN